MNDLNRSKVDVAIFISGVASDTSGKFTLSLQENRKYILQMSFIGYKDFYKNIQTILKSATDLNIISYNFIKIITTNVFIEMKTFKQT